MSNQIVLKAKEGHILTNGEVYGRQIHLAKGVDTTTFYEITEAEYQKMIETQECGWFAEMEQGG